MKKISLTCGKYAIVDDDDYASLIKYKWFAAWSGNRKWYAFRSVSKYKQEKMEHLILKPLDGFVVDHININGLDNRRLNLRFATYSQNMANTRKLKRRYGKCSSRYKGVDWNMLGKSWRARICINGRRFSLGGFKNEIDAAKAYDVAAYKNFGEFARLNLKELPIG